MALGAAAKYNVEVQIVPCGLTYFHGHRYSFFVELLFIVIINCFIISLLLFTCRFRGHCIVEFGQPLVVSPQSEWVERYKDKDQRRQVCSDLLDQVEKGLRGVLLLRSPSFFVLRSKLTPGPPQVTLNVPTYKDRQVALTVRSLYQPASLQLSSNKYQMLNRYALALARGPAKHSRRVVILGHHH